MKSIHLRFLRPYLYTNVREASRSSRRRKYDYAGFCAQSTKCVHNPGTEILGGPPKDTEVVLRVKELVLSGSEMYPRVKPSQSMTCETFRQHYQSLKPEESNENDIVTIHGRLHSTREASSKLVFLDVKQDGHLVQGLCDLRKMLSAGIGSDEFTKIHRLIRRGDIIALTGIPHRTKRGELSVKATKLPVLLAPSLHSLPSELQDQETRIRHRHEDLLVNPQTSEIIRLRSSIIQYLRTFLLSDNFVEIQTPIMSGGSGGAVARPFETRATEFPNKKLELRIAPELWLKRLVVGGIDRVFEIGPCFRNEGIDLTHNPEFTTCEFYKSFAGLEELIAMTESFLSGLAKQVNNLKETRLKSLPLLDEQLFSPPFKRIDFIPFLETALGRPLPDLSGPDATSSVIALFADLAIPLPPSPTLPRLLDKLSSTYIEPHCIAPTFIINHPECLSPLSKSFPHPSTSTPQRVAARMELVVHGTELVNAYEEENSPIDQRRKLVDQLAHRDDENRALMDESYLEALEWGLPPTGGWGCGLDRLVMLFAGSNRIGDVLPFGTLRNVVALSPGEGEKERADEGESDRRKRGEGELKI